MVYLLGYVASLVGFAALLWLPGYVVERGVLRLPPADPLRHLARLALGVVCWMACAFVLCALGLLQLAYLVGLCGIWSLLGLLVLLRARSHGSGAGAAQPGEAREAPPARRTLVWSSIVPLLLGLGVLVLALLGASSPMISWDANTYHLTVPRLYVEAGGFRPLELNVYSNWPLGLELLYALALLVRDHVLAKLVHLLLGGATAYGIYLGCRELGHSRAGGIAALLFLANGVVLFELQVAYIDLGYAFFMLTGFLFMRRAAAGADASARGALVMAGVCGAALVSLKLTGLFGAGCIGLLYLPTLRSGAGARIGGFAARFLAPIVGVAGVWAVKAWWYTGNPVYPFLFDWFGGPDWSAALGRQFATWQAGIGMGRGLLDYLLLPARVILQGGADYGHFNGELSAIWAGVLPLALVVGRRHRGVKLALVTAGVYFVLWALSSQQMRLLLPALPLLALAGGVSLELLLARIGADRPRAAARWLCLAAVATTLAFSALPALGGNTAWVGRYQQLGGETRERAIAPVFHFINRSLPRSARLLLLNTNHGFFCQRDYLADSFFEASQVAHWLRGSEGEAELRSRLASRRITHLLVRGVDWGIDYPAPLLRLLSDPRRLLYQSQDYRLYSVDPRP